jgi:capsular polysaccharide biosynthesis protein
MWIAAFTIFGLLAGFVYNDYIQVPLYKSSATLLMITGADTNTTQDTTLINNYINLIESRRVLDPIIKKQQLNISYDDFISSVEATNDKNTDVIKVAITTKDAETSKSLVENAVASFEGQVIKLYSTDNVQIVDNASLANQPYNVHKELQLVISAAAGLVLSVVVIFFIYDFKLNNKDAKDQILKTVKHTPLKSKNSKSLGKSFGSYIQRFLIKSANTKKDTNNSKIKTANARVKRSPLKSEQIELAVIDNASETPKKDSAKKKTAAKISLVKRVAKALTRNANKPSAKKVAPKSAVKKISPKKPRAKKSSVKKTIKK